MLPPHLSEPLPVPSLRHNLHLVPRNSNTHLISKSTLINCAQLRRLGPSLLVELYPTDFFLFPIGVVRHGSTRTFRNPFRASIFFLAIAFNIVPSNAINVLPATAFDILLAILAIALTTVAS